MRLRPIGIGAGEQHQHVGAGTERAPRLHAVDHVARLAVRPVGRCGGDLEAGDIGAEVGLGDGNGHHHFGRRQLRQPVLLLGLGAAPDQRPGQDLGPGDERPADAERAPRELLGRDHHGHVLAVAALGVALVLGRHRQAERAHLGQATDDRFRHVAVRAVDVLRDRLDLLLGERSERVLHHLEVRRQVARSGRGGERCDERRVAERLQERVGVAQRRDLEAPEVFPAGHLRDQVVHRVGHEGAGEPGLRFALRGVVEHRPGGLARPTPRAPGRTPPPGADRAHRARRGA